MLLRRSKNSSPASKTKLAFPESFSISGICTPCIICGACEIGYKAKTGRTIFPEPFGTAQFAAEKKLTCFDDIQILPELFGEEVFPHEVETKVKIGEIECEIPLVIAGMGSTKVASSLNDKLNIQSAKAGLIRVIGENILATFGEQFVKESIKQYKDNYVGAGGIIFQGNPIDIKLGLFEKAVSYGADGIEIKLGQGAKQGLGGEIKFEENPEKYEKLGYKVIKNPDGTYQRHTPPGSLENLEETLENVKGFGVPVWIKIGFGNGIFKFMDYLDDLKNKGYRIDCLTIDGFGGGTGMSPWIIMNEMNISSGAALSKIKERKYSLILAGGYSDGADVCKAMMLGADGVAMGRPFLIAAKVGDINKFKEALKEEIQMICATLRVKNVSKIKGKRENLFALSEEAKQLFGLKNEMR
ncbi:MAG: glutamate synthase-related protein [archaeon]